MRSLSLIVSLIFLAGAVHAGDRLDALIGRWVSADGSARQSFTRELDGSWISTRMWFRAAESWKLVAAGSLYRRPGEDDWLGVSRATDMDGIELFETRLRPVADAQFALHNVSYKGDGSTLISEETWSFDGVDRFTYTVYIVEDGTRTPMYEGTWIRDASQEQPVDE